MKDPHEQELRMERFAVLRAANPELDYDEIMGKILDEELEREEMYDEIPGDSW